MAYTDCPLKSKKSRLLCDSSWISLQRNIYHLSPLLTIYFCFDHIFLLANASYRKWEHQNLFHLRADNNLSNFSSKGISQSIDRASSEIYFTIRHMFHIKNKLISQTTLETINNVKTMNSLGMEKYFFVKNVAFGST